MTATADITTTTTRAEARASAIHPRNLTEGFPVLERNLVLASIFLALGSYAGAQTQPSPQPGFVPAPGERQCSREQMEKAVPYTEKQRWCYLGGRLIAPTGFISAAFMAGIRQAQDDPREWPQGAEGYSQRFGANLAQGATKKAGTFLAQAVFHEDPRMFVSNRHGFWRRTGFSVLNIFTATPANDPGNHRRFSPSYMLGSVASGFVGNTWYPPSNNNVADAWRRSGYALGGVAITSFIHEFGIDKKIEGVFFRHKQ
jgi:hypothetical protein